MPFPDNEYYSQLLHVFAKFTRKIHHIVTSKKVPRKEIPLEIEMTLFEMEEELKTCWGKYLEQNYFPDTPFESNALFFEKKLTTVRVLYFYN